MTNDELITQAERLMALHSKYYELDPRASNYDFSVVKSKVEELVKAIKVPTEG